MKRSERMAPVQRMLGNTERERARDLGAAQKQLDDAQTRLRDLQQYHDEYLQGFEQRARGGLSGMALRDYRLFLSRLAEAVRQQEQLVAQAREGVAGSTRHWQGAARQVKAVESVVGRWQGEERRHADRLEQKDTDERAQRRVGAGGSSGEHR